MQPNVAQPLTYLNTAPLKAVEMEVARASIEWIPPDLSILSNNRISAPALPLECFKEWQTWICSTAEGRACPADYVGVSLLVVAAALIGNARRVSPWDSWSEPAVLWAALIGPPSANKSPALDPLRSIISKLEQDDAEGYDATLRRWHTDVESAKQTRTIWQGKIAEAKKSGSDVPLMPTEAIEPEKPSRPRVLVGDITPEQLAVVHAGQSKGLLQYRDELSSWIGGMDRYGGNGMERAQYLEAFGARALIVDRAKHDKPLKIEHFSVSILGGIQPDRLSTSIMSGDDDGLSARFLYTWPDKVPARRPRQIADDSFALAACRRLKSLALAEQADGPAQPVAVHLSPDAQQEFETWWTGALADADKVGGKMAGHLGKLPGVCLRLSLVLQYLWWSANPSTAEPADVSLEAVAASIALIDDYFRPMAARAYGDAAMPVERRLASALAKYLHATNIRRFNARDLYKDGRVPGIGDADTAEAAINHLLNECGWLASVPSRAGGPGRLKKDYAVNPQVFGAVDG